MGKFAKLAWFGSVSFLCVATASAAPSDEVSEIVVTAQKRQTSAQATDIAMSAVSADTLEQQHIANLQDLGQSIPSVNFATTTANARISIRGLGFDNTSVGGEGRVAYHEDGVYLSRPADALGGFFDVERVEVLDGPQGTLYGRNSTAGTINVITRDPTNALSGYEQVGISNYSGLYTSGAVGGPLSDTLSARIAYSTVNHDGYGHDVATGEAVDNANDKAVRAKVRWEPNNDFSLLIEGDYFKEHDNSGASYLLGAGSPYYTPTGLLQGGTGGNVNDRQTGGNITPQMRKEFSGASATANWDMGWADLTSITALRNSRYAVAADLDGTSANVAGFYQTENSQQESEELRLSGKYSDGHYLAGVYLFNEHINGGSELPLQRTLFAPADTPLYTQGDWFGGNLNTDAEAVFGEVTWDVLDNLSATVGGRYSLEQKNEEEGKFLNLVTPYSAEHNPIIPTSTDVSSHNFYAFDPKFSLDYTPYKDVLLYTTISQAFKAGGYNLGGFQQPFAPEKITAYEVGAKSEWFDRRLRANAALFYYDYNDLQVSKIVGTAVQIVNAAKAKMKGAEFDLEAHPFKALTLAANGFILDSEYLDFTTADAARTKLGILNLSGNQMEYAPNYKVNLSAEYKFSYDFGEFSIKGEGNWVDKVYFSPFDLDTVSQPANATFNAFLGYRDGGGNWSVNSYVRNLANKLTYASITTNSTLVGAPRIAYLNSPRLFGIDFRYDF